MNLIETPDRAVAAPYPPGPVSVLVGFRIHNISDMRKTLLAASLLFGVCAASAAEAPVYAWSNLFDGYTTAGDQSQDIAIATDGSVYWHNVGGSTEATRDITYAGEVLFQGAPYNAGTSYSSNLCILKTAADGTLLWDLHSTTADFASGAGGVATTADGGVVFTAKLRHTDGMLDEAIELVDGTGASHLYAWNVDKRYYRLMVGRLDASGALQWVKFIDPSTDPTPAATTDFISDGADLTAPVVDGNGNIFVAGSFRTPMTISGPDGEVILTPGNVSEWDGKTSNAAGSMYVVKYSAAGSYMASLQDEGEATQSKILGLFADGDRLYIQGTVTGGETRMKIAGMEFTPEGTFTPVVACVDADFNGKWVNALKGETVDGKYGYQNTAINVVGGTLWLCGMFNGEISDPADASHLFASQTGKVREGFLLRLNAANGRWIKGVNSRDSYGDAGVAGTGLTGYLAAIQNPDHSDKVYVYGYVMNNTVGVFLRTYDADELTSNPNEAWQLASNLGTPSAIACAYEGSEEQPRLYFTARGNKAFTLGDVTTEVTSGWAVLMACYDLPADDFSTGVDSIVTPADSEDGQTEYYTLSGVRLNAAPTTAGIYISRCGAESRKFVVR